MKRIATLTAIVALLSLLPGIAHAAGTGLQEIEWIKVTAQGTMVKLQSFDLIDVDPAVCADPGLPYFYLPATKSNYEARVATLLSAHASGRSISIAYASCGENPGVHDLVQLGTVTIH